MKFKQIDKLKALAIVNIFETSRPFGNYRALAVLDDGAGVSYGISQFTHRSGALLNVVEEYLRAGGTAGAEIMTARLPTLRLGTRTAIETLAADTHFKNALRAAAVTVEMQRAQMHVTLERYLGPAERECHIRGFSMPLSLAVVYDSMIHGSWERMARTIATRKRPSQAAEMDWILEYVRERHRWLTSIGRLKATGYRTRFFIGQIAVSNWQLKLPLVVNGVRLTAETFASHTITDEIETPVAPDTAAVPPSVRADIRSAIGSAGERYDKVETAVSTLVRRADAAKSLWTTVAGTIWQAAWGIFGFVAGLPREIWIVVAVIAAVLMIFYLYRQLTLGRIRELAARSNAKQEI